MENKGYPTSTMRYYNLTVLYVIVDAYFKAVLKSVVTFCKLVQLATNGI